MFGFSVDCHIAAPPDVVFARASDFRRGAETITAIAKMEMLTTGPIGVGTRFRETRMMFGREATEEMTITAFEPPKRYTLSAESHGSRYHTELSFAPDGQGTRMTMTFQGTPVTLMARIMSVLMKPMMKKVAQACAKDLDDIKAAAERDYGAAVTASA
jgi:carbon monoxide dehydrogenase subunit G